MNEIWILLSDLQLSMVTSKHLFQAKIKKKLNSWGAHVTEHNIIIYKISKNITISLFIKFQSSIICFKNLLYLPIVPPMYVIMNNDPTFSLADLTTITLMQGNCSSVTSVTEEKHKNKRKKANE